MIAFLASLTFVVLAEMGDKTQLLAMAFACKYQAHKVLIAVFIATLLNHALAVAVGRFLTTIVPIDVISLIAALSFILFGLWTIRGDRLEGEDKKESKYGPVVTVAIAFFLAEMGDKTQLATISLAVKYGNMLQVLMGTTTGMIVADALGILVGVVMSKRIPERTIKWISASVFVLFGILGVNEALNHRIGALNTCGVIALLCAVTGAAAAFVSRRSKPSFYAIQRQEDIPAE